MQAIVADTTPVNYLVLIQAADILPNLYRTVLSSLMQTRQLSCARGFRSPPWLEVASLKLPVDSALDLAAEVASSSLVVPAILSKAVKRISLKPSRARKGRVSRPFCAHLW
jgi:hypothetical protein